MKTSKLLFFISVLVGVFSFSNTASALTINNIILPAYDDPVAYYFYYPLNDFDLTSIKLSNCVPNLEEGGNFYVFQLNAEGAETTNISGCDIEYPVTPIIMHTGEEWLIATANSYQPETIADLILNGTPVATPTPTPAPAFIIGLPSVDDMTSELSVATIGIFGDMSPVAMIVIGVTLGLGFLIWLINRFKSVAPAETGTKHSGDWLEHINTTGTDVTGRKHYEGDSDD
jgi:hypothetical protein